MYSFVPKIIENEKADGNESTTETLLRKFWPAQNKDGTPSCWSSSEMEWSDEVWEEGDKFLQDYERKVVARLLAGYVLNTVSVVGYEEWGMQSVGDEHLIGKIEAILADPVGNVLVNKSVSAGYQERHFITTYIIQCHI